MIESNFRVVTLFRAATAAAVLAVLGACGGGGGGGGEGGGSVTPPPPTPLSASELHGRWQSAEGITPAVSAYLVPQSEGSATTVAWSLGNDLVLGRYTVGVSGEDGVSLTGNVYQLGSAEAPAVDIVSGTVNLTTRTISLQDGLSFVDGGSIAGSVDLAAVAGSWQMSAGQGFVGVQLSVDAQGALSGASSTGCDYSGTLSARAEFKILDVALQETCGQVVTSFAGIATYRATPENLTVLAVNTDAQASSALGLFLARP